MSELVTGARWWKTGEVVDLLVGDDGLVVAREPSGKLHKAATKVVEAQEKWLLPKFVDAHCHILPMGLDLAKLNLGRCTKASEVLDAVRDYDRTLETGEWLLAVHYDQTKFSGAQHLSRHDLDQISTARPILLRHVNGHASVANTAALQAAGVSDDTRDPAGGTFARDSAGQLTGVLLERAHEIVTSRAPEPSFEAMVEAILRAAKVMHRYGIGMASDMMTGRWNLLQEIRAYHEASQKGSPVRFRLYMQWGSVYGPKAAPMREIRDHLDALKPLECRAAGVKIFADGAIGSATAAIYGRFETDPPGSNDSGQLIYAPERLKEMLQMADADGWQVAVHSIGDRATDCVMDALSAVANPSRHRIEHAMMLSDAQIERMANLGCFCTMQPEFLHRFAHSYLTQLGPIRCSRLKRAASVAKAGIPLSFSSDMPIVSGDPVIGISTIIDRPALFDASENVTLAEAIDGYTRQGSRVNGDGDDFGTLEPGSVGDYHFMQDLPGAVLDSEMS